MDLLYSVLFTVVILFLLVFCKCVEFYRKHECLSTLEIRANAIVYLIAVSVSYIFGLLASFRESLEKYIPLDFDSLLLIIAFATILILLVKESGDLGYVEKLNDISGVIFFVSSILSSLISLTLCFLFLVPLLFKYKYVDEGDNNYILALIVNILVDVVANIIWTVITVFVIEKIFVFTFTETLIYVAVILFVSGIIIPLTNSLISKRIYNLFAKSE